MDQPSQPRSDGARAAAAGFDHLLLTRFNLIQPERPMFDKGLDEAWLAHRMRLFERYCLPSVLAQSNSGFRWILLIHPDTPRSALEALDRAAGRCPQISLARIPSADPPSLSRVVAEHAGREYLITSRVDNDDALARDYIETVQSLFRPSAFEFVNFRDVAFYDEPNRRFLTRVRHGTNPFVSLIERNGAAVRTVLGVSHDRIDRRYGARHVRTGRPMALAVGHERNLVNRAEGCIASPARMRERFALDIDFPAEPLAVPVRRLLCRLGLRLASWWKRAARP